MGSSLKSSKDLFEFDQKSDVVMSIIFLACLDEISEPNKSAAAFNISDLS